MPEGETGGHPQELASIQTMPKTEPLPLAPDSPPSPSALSASSSSSSSSVDSLSVAMRPSGDLLHPLKAKGWSSRKAEWTSNYRGDKEPLTALRLITWNVDFMQRDTAGRLECILSYLQDSILSSSPPPSCILLQELDASSLAAILLNAWVREHYVVTPPTTEHWKAHYGNATLISRVAPFQNTQMLVFANSHMGRAAIFVDVAMRSPDSGEVRTVRIANTHLESLPQGANARPKQLAAIADLLRGHGIDAGIVGGDMNMIGDVADQSIHVAAGLRDACHSPDDPSSHTWGYQPSTRYPPGRLDRVFFVGDRLHVDPVEVIGKGLRTKTGQWASDHYGLTTTLSFRS
ncbi:Endonuclease/exonuclease/phosphatase [Trametes punicea]|nr:Endonuclease/exonuclease/phosphatase [Trametes punicea]